MLRAEKTEKVKELRERFEQMSSAVLVDYQGMTVAEASNLRDVFRAKGIIYKVVKNTLVRHALADQPWAKNLEPALHGMTGIAWSFDEPSAAARAAPLKRRVRGHSSREVELAELGSGAGRLTAGRASRCRPRARRPRPHAGPRRC